MMRLRQQISEEKEAIKQERKKTVDLLYQMFPPSVAQNLWDNKPVDSIHCDDVTIVFVRVVDFNRSLLNEDPVVSVGLLDDLYTAFDRLCGMMDVYKWEAVGGRYS